jgi:hypothetical protein
LLQESCDHLESEHGISHDGDSLKAQDQQSERRVSAPAPPPITEVLQDVYPEDGGTGIN